MTRQVDDSSSWWAFHSSLKGGVFYVGRAITVVSRRLQHRLLALFQAVMVGRDALLIAGSLAYRYKTRQAGDAFFDLDSIDYKVTPSTLSKVRNTGGAGDGDGIGAAAVDELRRWQQTPLLLIRLSSCHRSSCSTVWHRTRGSSTDLSPKSSP